MSRLRLNKGQNSLGVCKKNSNCDLFFPQNHLGFYDWKKICLFIYFTLIIIIIIGNAALLLWILTIIKLSAQKMERIGLLLEGINLDGQVTFFKDIFLHKLSSFKNQKLTIESKVGIKLKVKGDSKHSSTQIQVDPHNVKIICDQLIIKDSKKNAMLLIDDKINLETDKLRLKNSKGINFNQSLQTPVIQSKTKLKIESLSRKILIRGPIKTNFYSKLGNLSIKGFKKLIFKSKSGNIYLKTSHLKMDKIKTIISTKRGKSYPDIMQLCACQNGQLFMSPSESSCSSDDSICDTNNFEND